MGDFFFFFFLRTKSRYGKQTRLEIYCPLDESEAGAITDSPMCQEERSTTHGMIMNEARQKQTHALSLS